MDTWEKCFDFCFRYTFTTFLPPFVSPSKFWLGYLTTLIILSNFVRSVLLITEEGKANFDSYYVVIQMVHVSSRSIVYLCQRKRFVKFSEDVNKILKLNENDYHHINSSESSFEKFWIRERPKKFVKYYYTCQSFSYFVWLCQATLRIITHDDSASDTEPLFPFYDPLYKWGRHYKIIGMLCDSTCMTILFFQMLQPDIVTVSFLNFANCLMIYLKVLLNGMLRANHSESNKKLWIQRHVQVLNLIRNLTELLKPHITIQYVCQAAAVVATLLSILEKDTTQTFWQKMISTIVVIGTCLILCYECNIVEKLSKTHGSMHENLLDYKIICGSKNDSLFLKMLTIRSNTQLPVRGYIFKMNKRSYADMVRNAYGLYSSLFSLKA